VLHPIYSATGDYPPVMKQWMAKKCKEEGCSRSRLPSFTEEEIELVKGEFQFRVTLDIARRKKTFAKIVLTYISSYIKILSG
jgi:hypothetical protein